MYTYCSLFTSVCGWLSLTFISTRNSEVYCKIEQIIIAILFFKNTYSGSMQDLTAQVTSDLLQFPEVTIEALGEDEITLESVLRGKFAAGK